MKRCFLYGALVLLMGAHGSAQAPSPRKPAFEVASIKRNTSGTPQYSINMPGCRFITTNATVKELLLYAYRPTSGQFRRDQVIGGPAWLDTDRFDIQAKPEGERPSIPHPEMQQMVQALLQDRFQLKAHIESRELPVYELVVTKDGPKIKWVDDQTPESELSPTIFCSPTAPSRLPRRGVSLIGTPNPAGMLLTITASATSVPTFIDLIQPYTDRLILNKTGLKGMFDFKMQFGLSGSSPNAGTPLAEPSGPSIFTGVQDLGLKLESTKAPIEVLVIDSVQRPSEN